MKKYRIGIIALVSCISFAQEKKWNLQDCVNYALENNISVKQSELDKKISKENIKTSKGNFLPNLSGSTGQNFNFGSFIGQDGGRVSADSRGNTLGLNSGVILFNGFQNTNLYKQSKLGLKSSELQLEVLKNNISLNVANSYLNILFNKENLRIAEEKIRFTQEQLIQMQEFVDSGIRARADLLEIKAQLASDQESLVRAENSVDLSLLTLAQLLQISPDNFDVENVEVALSELQLLYENPKGIYDVALEEMPEIESANIGMKNSEMDTKIAKGAYYPTLSFGASMTTSYQHRQGTEDVIKVIDNNGTPLDFSDDFIVDQPNGFGVQLENNLGYNLSLNLSIPIFNRFQTKTNVARAKINEAKSSLVLEQAKQDLRSNIESAYADAKAALKQYETSKISVESQELAFENAKDRYDLGVITSFDFEQVRNRLVNAQSSLINAKYNFMFKTKVLDFYAGKSLVE